MCKARVVLNCPNCKRQMEVTRPDSLHPVYSLDKPREAEIEGDVIEAVHVCQNPHCKSRIKVYWYETRMFLDRG